MYLTKRPKQRDKICLVERERHFELRQKIMTSMFGCALQAISAIFQAHTSIA
ncbi:Protein of unknown function [Pyronema omphalodes CBS 100304]|uniref:Uncharacterized protein n=1 Tax=Pyronema omphalodes (strain CBS 100304) TaxID=1076935 RepID=U4LNR0_PYROM|nr:Protein of unknown function [Pyronema omphalodes CBS 100304]